MPRKERPERRMDMDRGSSTGTTVKKPRFLDPEVRDERQERRWATQDLDDRIESDPRVSRAGKDAARSMPRETNDELRHPRMRRMLPEQGQVRRPFSSRQRKARSKAKFAAQDRMPGTEYEAIRETVWDESPRWVELNDALSDAAGDIHADNVSDDLRLTGQRLDRAIQRYERLNDRGHVVYAQARMPYYVNASNVAGYANNHFPVGTLVAFDRYTASTHSMHELEQVTPAGEEDRHVVLEIQTRRGIYLGASDSTHDTRHLLPRALELEVVGSHVADYERPDGSMGRRTVIQMMDITGED